jgi:hypothetical protein
VTVVKGDPRCLRNEPRFQAIDVVISSVRSRENYRLSMSGGWWPIAHAHAGPFRNPSFQVSLRQKTPICLRKPTRS